MRARCVHLRPPLTRLDGQLSGGRGPRARLAPGSPLAFPAPSARPPRLPDPPPAPRHMLKARMPRGTRCGFPTAAPAVGRPAALPGLGQPGARGGGGGRGPWTGQERSFLLQSCSEWGRGTTGWKVKKYFLKHFALCKKELSALPQTCCAFLRPLPQIVGFSPTILCGQSLGTFVCYLQRVSR